MRDTFKALKDKYAHLEFSILPLSKALKDNETKRLDNEYFKKEYLENEELLKCLNSKKLESFICKMTGGATPLGADYPDSGIPFLRVQNIMQNYFNLNDIVYISNKDDEALKRSRLKRKDMLLTITGAYGKAAVVEDNLVGANINQHSVKIELKDINPYFLATFINSKYGQLQCDKKITGVTRPALDYQVIKNFLIPLFDSSFQAEIEKIVKDSHHKLEQSKSLYKEAEGLLYESLGFLGISKTSNLAVEYVSPQSEKFRLQKDALQSLKAKFPHLNISIKPLSKSLQKSGRLDSEYYQAKYESIEALIKSHLCEKLGDLVNIKKSIEPGSEAYQSEGIEFVRVSNLSKFGISKSDIYLSKEKFGKDLVNLAPQKETILLSKDGSVGISYCVEEVLDCITSGAILHLRVKDKKQILPQVLSLILNSITTQLQAERDSGGSIIAHWKISEIENILIPLLDSQTQEQIASKLKLSFALKKEAKELLDLAKSKVECAIKSR